MDTESLRMIDNDDAKVPRTNTGHHRRILRTLLVWTGLLAVTGGAGYYLFVYWNQTGRPILGGPLVLDSASLPRQDAASTSAVHKKIHPPHPKKLHHGEVLYTIVQDPDMGRYYKRQFLIPCGYGLLVFNIAPADQAMPYDLDIFDDGYVFSDNGGLCVLYPSYKAYQNNTQPFWMPDDPTSFHVPLGHEMTKISHRINKHPHTKDTSHDSDKVQQRGGDYLIMAKHDFYTPAYYRQLKHIVNSWKIADIISADNDNDMQALHQAVQEALMMKATD